MRLSRFAIRYVSLLKKLCKQMVEHDEYARQIRLFPFSWPCKSAVYTVFGIIRFSWHRSISRAWRQRVDMV